MSDIIQVNPLVFGGEGEAVHANVLTKLWENPNPYSVFAAQPITLASDDYDFLLVDVKYAYNSSNIVNTLILAKGYSGLIGFGDIIGGISKNEYRLLTRSSDTSYSFTDAYVESTVSNNYLIPLAIYGFKKSLDITAIVSEVSTDASKCMLSDGVTSVEDALVKSTEVTITNKTVAGNNKANLGSLTSGLPAGSKFVSWIPKTGFDTDLVLYLNGGNLLAYNINSSSHTISTAKVDVFYI